MIQRKQTLYLLLATVLTAILFFSTYFSIEISELDTETATVDYGLCTLRTWGGYSNGNMFLSTTYMAVLVGLTALVSFFTIFLYRHRWMQVRLCWALIIMQLGIMGFMAYYIVSLIGVIPVGASGAKMYSIVDLFPLLSIVATILAYRGITADIALLRSADRIR